MPDLPATAAQFERYLGALGVPGRRASLDALTELTTAHLARIPFENVSKLYYRHDATRGGLPNLARFLEGVERYRFGGTCYSNNVHFHELLAHLGYRVTLCGADMASPNVHVVNIVALEGRPYLVDVGYGAPLVEPLPLDAAGDREVRWGTYRYVLKPRDGDGRSRLDMYRGDALSHGYTVTPTPRRVEDFAGVIAASFSERATFMHALLIARFGERRSVMLRNLTLARDDGSEWRTREIPDPAQLPGIVYQEFGMPVGVVRRALDGIQLTRQP